MSKKDTKSGYRITPLRIIILLIVLVGFYYLLPQLGDLHTTWTVLTHASLLWLLIALLVGNLTFIAAAFTQFMAGDQTGTFLDIVFLQYAGAFVDHFLPFSLGGIDMTASYYQKFGQSRPKALVYATIPIVFGILTTILIVLVVSPITIVQLFHSIRNNDITRYLSILVGVVAVITLCLLPHYAKRVRYLRGQAMESLRSIHGFQHIAKVCLGAASITITSAIVLYLSVAAIHVHAGLVAVIVLCISSSLVSNITPTPGGLGTTEAVLIFGLSHSGLDVSQATAATLLYRLITFWLPMIPGAFALAQCRKRNFFNT